MSATFTWHVTSLDVANSTIDSHNDVVSVVHWNCSASQDANGTTYFASVNRNTPIPYDSASYSKYSNLTEQKVLSWVWKQTTPIINNKSNPLTIRQVTENELQASINAQIKPAITTPELPW